LKIEPSDDPRVAFDRFFVKTPIPYTCEWKEVDRQLKILMKGELNEIDYKITLKKTMEYIYSNTKLFYVKNRRHFNEQVDAIIIAGDNFQKDKMRL